MRVSVDLTKCNGYANCVMEAPEVFDVDPETGFAIVLQESPPEELREKVKNAERLCPVQAIHVED